MIDLNKLTLGEIAKVEDLADTSIADLGEDGRPQIKLLAGLVFVMKRREQMAQGLPVTYTWNEALGLTNAEAEEFLGLNAPDDEPETPPESVEAAPKATPAARTARKSDATTKN